MDVPELFPVTRKYAYLNSAAVAPLSTRARDAMRRLVGDQCAHGALHYSEWFSAYDACREAAARLINAESDEIALLPSTSAGLNTIARGLRLRPGDNIVISAREFPANVYPWMAQGNVEVRTVVKRGGRLLAEDVAAQVNAKTRAVSVSFVDWLTGHRPDLKSMAAIAHGQGALFVVDAIQGLGALPLDVEECGIDAMAADGHKWLCGPEGSAILYVRRDVRERIVPSRTSWLSVRHPTRFSEVDPAPHPSARRYEEGTPNTAGIHGLLAALELILELGIGAIAARVLHLSSLVRQGALAKGLVLACDAGGDEASGIVSIVMEDAWTFAQALEARGIIVAAREGHIRVATHHFNSEQDVERLLEAFA